MLGPSIFIPVLAVICAYAFLRGGREERLVAAMCIAGVLATKFLISPLDQRYDSIELGIVLVDSAMLLGFIWVALHTKRFWPLWIAGLQLTTTFGHLFKSINFDLLPQAYGAALVFWSYPILFILAIGTWRGHKRLRQTQLESDAASV
ncbi:MAG: hypothetical protein HKO13_10375 [Sphingomonas sp.]|nr:hypothetical protein [Sphingomonas sp.]RZV53329.1 MAG: hypothetical protein EX258_00515 [Sphingomonadaceae bacterium]